MPSGPAGRATATDAAGGVLTPNPLLAVCAVRNDYGTRTAPPPAVEEPVPSLDRILRFLCGRSIIELMVGPPRSSDLGIPLPLRALPLLSPAVRPFQSRIPAGLIEAGASRMNNSPCVPWAGVALHPSINVGRAPVCGAQGYSRLWRNPLPLYEAAVVNTAAATVTLDGQAPAAGIITAQGLPELDDGRSARLFESPTRSEG